MIISARGGKSLDGDPYLLPKKKIWKIDKNWSRKSQNRNSPQSQ